MLLPLKNREIEAENANGWVQINDPGDGICFLDQNMKKVLDLGHRYEKVYAFEPVSQ